jgi:hypothetical protein
VAALAVEPNMKPRLPPYLVSTAQFTDVCDALVGLMA